MSSTPAGAGSRPRRSRTYFFLSYAHSAPLAAAVDPGADADPWVGVFYRDLSEAVRRRARPVAGMELSFIDQNVPVGADWKTELTEALSAAEVFVALYAPGYFKKSWPQRELESFRQRLVGSGDPRSSRHFLPVLWLPFLPWDRPADIADALSVGRDAPDYEDNGVRGLRMLAHFENQYRRVVERVAKHIVDTAEGSPLRPSRAPSFDELPPIGAGEPEFVVAVFAPDRRTLPAGRLSATYDSRAVEWRPFAEQVLTVAEHAASTAERLGLATQVGGLAEVGKRLDGCPAVILIDPWAIANPSGIRALRRALSKLAGWTLPVIIADDQDPQFASQGRELADRAVATLAEAGVPFITRISQVREFADVMPGLITAARRQYLANGPVPEGSD